MHVTGWAEPLCSPIAKHQHMQVTGGQSYHAPCGRQYAGSMQRCHQSWLEGSHACVPCSVVSFPDLLVQTRVEGSGDGSICSFGGCVVR